MLRFLIKALLWAIGPNHLITPAGGQPQYSGNFIPEIWSGKLVEKFYDATVFGEIANTDC
jgi:hypothetical protein